MTLYYDPNGGQDACNSGLYSNVYYALDDPNGGTLTHGHTYYDSYGFPYNGNNMYFSDGSNNYGTINNNGYYSSGGTCD